jgi:hypothetical protein
MELTLPADVRGPIEFKFTRGSWEKVEVDSAGRGVENRRFTVPAEGAVTWTGRVGGWQDPAKIPPRPHRHRVRRRARHGVRDPAARPRAPRLDLPAAGVRDVGRRYPVLYMHDGQNVFDAATSGFGEWGVDETLDSLHARGGPDAIVVAVDHGGRGGWTSTRRGATRATAAATATRTSTSWRARSSRTSTATTARGRMRGTPGSPAPAWAG